MMDARAPAVSVAGFKKTYGQVQAVRGIEFEVRRGEILALLGPNGAGKTSTLECIEGLRRPDAGMISVFGMDPARETVQLARRIGVQLQSQGLPSSMTAREALEFFARYRGMMPDFSAASGLGLEAKMDAQISGLSIGQQRKLALALAIQHSPELVILDEPTAGLDVETRDRLHGIMAGLRKSGTTILLATHDMAEAEKLADRVIVIVEGRLAAVGTPRELTAGGSKLTKVAISTRDSTVLREKPTFGEVAFSFEGEYALCFSSEPGKLVRELLAWIEGQGDEIVDLRVERPSLEERFLEIVKSR